MCLLLAQEEWSPHIGHVMLPRPWFSRSSEVEDGPEAHALEKSGWLLPSLSLSLLSPDCSVIRVKGLRFVNLSICGLLRQILKLAAMVRIAIYTRNKSSWSMAIKDNWLSWRNFTSRFPCFMLLNRRQFPVVTRVVYSQGKSYFKQISASRRCHSSMVFS